MMKRLFIVILILLAASLCFGQRSQRHRTVITVAAAAGATPPVNDAVTQNQSTPELIFGNSADRGFYSYFVHQMGSVSNGLLVIGVGTNGALCHTDSVIVKNGTTRYVATKLDDASAYHALSLWYLLSPPAGADTIKIYEDTTSDYPFGNAWAMSFSGANQGGGIFTFGTVSKANGSGASPASINVTSASDQIVIDICQSIFQANAIWDSLHTTQTYRASSFKPGDPDRVTLGSSASGAASVAMGYTWTGSNRAWAMMGVGIKPAGAIAREATVVDTFFTNGDNRMTWSFPLTIGNNSNRLLLLFVQAVNSAACSYPLDSLKFNGTSLTQLDTLILVAGTPPRVARVYYMVAPPVGTYNITGGIYGTCDNSNNVDFVCLSYYNVNQGGGSATLVAGQDSIGQENDDWNTKTVTSAVNELVVDYAIAQNASILAIDSSPAATVPIWRTAISNKIYSHVVFENAGSASTVWHKITHGSGLPGAFQPIRLKPAN